MTPTETTETKPGAVDHLQHPDLVQRGDTGQEVMLLQSLLRIQVDGIFGAQTEAAVRAFQQAKGLPIDGIVGEHTRDALVELMPPSTPPASVTDPVQLRGLQAAARLASLKGKGKYVLGAGGTSPNSTTPFGWKGSVYGCDCIGAVLWAFGVPRSTPIFPEYQGDINVDSAMMDAGAIPGGKGGAVFFRVLPKELVRPGSIVVFPSVRAAEVGEKSLSPSYRLRIGHVGIVCGWEGLSNVADPHATPWNGDISRLSIAECSGGDPAVKYGLDKNFHVRNERREFVWNGVTHSNDGWRTQFLEFHYGLGGEGARQSA